MTERLFPAPAIDPESKPYWDATQLGKLLIKYCNGCEKYFHYPRSLCPFCSSAQTQWREASGRGEIYSFSTLRRVAEPYTVAYVTLAEGPKMLTNIVDCDFDKLQIGQKVHLAFKPAAEAASIPVFTPDLGSN